MICVECGSEYTPKRSKNPSPYCCWNCYQKSYIRKRKREQPEMLEQEVERNCVHCGSIFNTSHPTKIYCSRKCKESSKRTRNQNKEHVLYNRTCPICKEDFTTANKYDVFCSDGCRQSSLPTFDESERNSLSSGVIGAVSEAEVASALMRQGFYVYRNMAPVGKADLVAWRDGELYLIDVKTSHSQVPGDRPESVSFISYENKALKWFNRVNIIS